MARTIASHMGYIEIGVQHMLRTHRYTVTVPWTGNTGSGTSDYRAYSRSHEITSAQPKPAIPGSADPLFRGDKTRWNPEELLIAALSLSSALVSASLRRFRDRRDGLCRSRGRRSQRGGRRGGAIPARAVAS
jgi:hypothetical protein